MQPHADKLKPLALEFHRLTYAMSQFLIHDIKLLAIVHCRKKWTTYLDGGEFLLRTDNQRLV